MLVSGNAPLLTLNWNSISESICKILLFTPDSQGPRSWKNNIKHILLFYFCYHCVNSHHCVNANAHRTRSQASPLETKGKALGTSSCWSLYLWVDHFIKRIKYFFKVAKVRFLISRACIHFLWQTCTFHVRTSRMSVPSSGPVAFLHDCGLILFTKQRLLIQPIPSWACLRVSDFLSFRSFVKIRVNSDSLQGQDPWTLRIKQAWRNLIYLFFIFLYISVLVHVFSIFVNLSCHIYSLKYHLNFVTVLSIVT